MVPRTPPRKMIRPHKHYFADRSKWWGPSSCTKRVPISASRIRKLRWYLVVQYDHLSAACGNKTFERRDVYNMSLYM